MRITALALLVLTSSTGLEPASARTLRVLTYNIHHSEGRDSQFDLDRIASVIRAANPDIVALQELDQGNSRSGFDVFQLDRLAELTSLNGYFGKTINYMGGEYGNGVLINPAFNVTRTINHALPSPTGGEARGVLEVRVALDAVEPQVDFSFFATHFDAGSGDANRLAQAAFVNDVVDGSTIPAILAGDLNSRPSSDAIDILRDEWTDATNVADPGISRSSQIDYVLYRQPQQWGVVQKGRFIVNTTTLVASDHYPLLTVLDLRSPVADFDASGDVDGGDFLTWQRGFGSGTTPGQGDANGDSAVNGADLTVWKSQFSVITALGPPAIVIPEPASTNLLTIVACALRIRTSHSRRPSADRHRRQPSSG
jgi:endonuclease/exonuclease/phosphatase family metal-dependent hydrolase